MTFHLPSPFLRAALALVALLALASPPALAQNEFGAATSTGADMIGTLYDLKQTQQREPTGISVAGYKDVLGEFFSSGWDEAILNKYFRATRPLYISQFFIPVMSADAAPKAFDVEDTVKPRLWVAHYKGQVTPPSSGEWRFWGHGDDVLAVAVNGKIVLVSNWGNFQFPKVPWKSPEPPSQKFAGASLYAGDWMNLTAGEVVDLDVLIGELPGSLFSSFLLVEKRGEDYGEAEGHKLYPIFKLMPHDTQAPEDRKKAPLFAKDGPIWKAMP